MHTLIIMHYNLTYFPYKLFFNFKINGPNPTLEPGSVRIYFIELEPGKAQIQLFLNWSVTGFYFFRRLGSFLYIIIPGRRNNNVSTRCFAHWAPCGKQFLIMVICLKFTLTLERPRESLRLLLVQEVIKIYKMFRNEQKNEQKNPVYYKEKNKKKTYRIFSDI